MRVLHKGKRVTLWIRAEMGNLGTISRFIKDWLTRQGGYQGQQRERYLVELAVMEACTNVIRYAYPSPLSGNKFCISLKRSGREIEILILDKGHPFNPMNQYPPNLDTPTESGYGIYLIREIMHDVSYYRRGSRWNCLRLVQHIPSRHSPSQVWHKVGDSKRTGKL